MLTEPQINDLQTELDTLAQNIHDDSLLLAEKQTEQHEIDDEIEQIKAALMSEIFNERFEINHKLKHTNDDQRRVRLIELQNERADYKTLVAARRNSIQAQAGIAARIEMQRKSFKAKELTLLYHSNNPAA
ncbi:MAG: hypothetical protein ACR2HT_04220 [Pyrinomonadaceae bacterium]